MEQIYMYCFLLTVTVFSGVLCDSHFDNVRCKCICPAEPDISKDVDIQVVTVSIPEECSCELVMKRNESGCLHCECKYESRNTTTIQVVVWIIIGIVLCLFLYMVFLCIMDPGIFRSKLTQPQPEDSFIQQPDAPVTTQTSYLGRMGNAQRRWKSQVQQQRQNIFDRHTILS